ncbi:MAG: hypothetical protein Q9159_005490 [Coniocarpon cinnabarinum]
MFKIAVVQQALQSKQNPEAARISRQLLENELRGLSDEKDQPPQTQIPPKGLARYIALYKQHWIVYTSVLILILLLATVALALGLTLAQDHSKRLPGSSNHLPAQALAVKNPYLSTWLSGEFCDDVTKATPQFWTTEPITWNILARVGAAGSSSAVTYNLFGNPHAVDGARPAVQQGPVTYTSTHTYVKLQAGQAQFLLDFFSPVSPNNLVRHSMPYSYLTVEVTAGKKTDVQIMSSIDHTWTAQGTKITANLNTNGPTTYFTLGKPDAITFQEHFERAAWGTTVFASQSNQSSALSAGCDTPRKMQSSFMQGHAFSKPQGQTTCKGDAVFALAHQLRDVQKAKSVTFAVGLYRENAINYLGKPQTPYFRSKYRDIPSSLNAFFADYNSAWKESQSLDNLVRSHANKIGGSNYADILEASVRQTFGALEVVIPADTLSTAPQDVNGFLKEISSDGNVNSIDVIYPTFPILYVLSPQWIKLLLQPMLEYLVTPHGVWNRNSVPHDLGNHYPNATGHNDNKLEVIMGREEWMPLEVTGSLFSLLHAYVQATKDYDFLKRYMGPSGNYLLTQYADFLVDNGTAPLSQLTTVDSLKAVTNTTQLAMQAAIAVSAMGAMSNLTNYTAHGADMTRQILNNDVSAMDAPKTHFAYAYNQPTSFSVMFPLFADKLANLPGSNSFKPAYDMQSNFYRGLLDQHPLGIPYSSKEDWAVTDWNMWSATITAPDVTKLIIDTTHQFLKTMQNGVVFGTKYMVEGKLSGKWCGNTARPTVGSNFALWAIQGHSFVF